MSCALKKSSVWTSNIWMSPKLVIFWGEYVTKRLVDRLKTMHI